MSKRFFRALLILALLLIGGAAGAQTADLATTLTYQGYLTDSAGSPVDNLCDFGFALHSALTGNTIIGSGLSLPNVPVSDGIFSVQLDFGETAFDGSDRYLEIGVRCPAGAGAYTLLSPRQPVTPAPYAIFASRAQEAESAQTAVTAQTVANGAFWSLGGNEGITNLMFLGTRDNVSLDIRVNNQRVMRYRPESESPALIGGSRANSITSGVQGGFIGGGGSLEFPNRVYDDYGVVAGGANNRAGSVNPNTTPDASYATVGGGVNNAAEQLYATIGGGFQNDTDSEGATIAGGAQNEGGGTYASVGGGAQNAAFGDISVIAGGLLNRANGYGAAIGGGSENSASQLGSTIAGGEENVASAQFATIGGGTSNTVSGNDSTISGGFDNTISSIQSAIGGGGQNLVSDSFGVVSGGVQNTVSDRYATIGGGYSNLASGGFAAIPGGWENNATADYTVAIGSNATADNRGAIVISDGSLASLATAFASNADGEFAVRAAGGVRLRTNTAATTGCNLPAGSGTWDCTSDRSSKENFENIDPQFVLSQVAQMPITTWEYIGTETRHIGPVAQDFYAAFGLGSGETTISSVDADGVALAAIQGLLARIEALESENAALRQQLDDFDARLSALESIAAPAESSLGGPSVLLGVLIVGGLWWARRKGPKRAL